MKVVLQVARGATLTLVLGVVAAGLHFLPGAADWLVLDRGAIASGELWRLLTGHLVHWTTGHLFWDVTAFVALGAPCEMRGSRRYAGALLATSLLLSGVVLVMLPSLELYAGLSGLDSVLFAWLALDVMRETARGRRVLAWLLGAACSVSFSLKMLHEASTGTPLFANDLAPDVIPVPVVHMAGAALGLLCAALTGPGERVLRRSRDPDHPCIPRRRLRSRSRTHLGKPVRSAQPT